MNPFAQIRDACRAVAETAELVRIDRDALPAYAASLPVEEIAAPSLDPKHHYLGHGEATAAFVLTLDAINFGSGYFPHLRKRPGMSGYFTVASSLSDHARERGVPTPEQLAGLTAHDCAAIFGQDPDNAPAFELMGLFARALNDLGSYVIGRFHGRFLDLIAAADHSAARLLGLLAAMPMFDDVAGYRGLRVPFYKRAQIASADLSLADEHKEGWGRFDDLDELTIFADNLVPHVLRLDGVLRYDPGLAARIDREEPIAAGSPEEVEIRACALHAVELLVDELRRPGRPTTAAQLDYLLWNRGQLPHYKQTKPRHRARSVFY